MKLALSILKWIGGYSLLVIGAYAWFTTEIDKRSSAIASNVESKIMAVRSADMTHIDSRFREMRDFQNERFDNIERLIRNNKK